MRRAIPAAVSGTGPWKIVSRKSMGGVSLSESVMFAPPGDSPEARAIRAHEYGHLETARQKLFPVPRAGFWYQAAADAYTNGLLQGSEVDISSLPFPDQFEEFDQTELAQIYTRAQHLNKEVQKKIEPLIKDQDSLSTANNLIHKLRRRGQNREKVSVEELSLILQTLQLLFPEDETEMMPGTKEVIAQGGNTLSTGEWGEMEIVQLPLQSVRTSRTVRKYRPSVIGAFRYPHRADLLISDGRCFSLKQRLPGGTVLIDWSGSMRLSKDEIKQLIDLAPAATVALYSGDETTGNLLIYAQKGKQSSLAEAYRQKAGGGNIIDGPALDWLAKQTEPRIWVCDGCVTGLHDAQYLNLTVEAAQKMQSGKIRRLDNLESALNFFKQRRSGREFSPAP